MTGLEVRFTDRAIKSLHPRQVRYEITEEGRAGLRIRVSPTGGKSWILVYRRKAKLARITMGSYPEMSLAEAHGELARLRGLLRKGTDPVHAQQALKQEEIDAPTVTQLAHLYIERYAKARKRSWLEDQRILEKDVIVRWRQIKAKDITRRDVVALLDDIVDRGSPIATNRTLACVRKMFNYAVERSILETSPCVAVKAPSKENRRDRVLSEDEIRAFWEGIERTTISIPIRYARRLRSKPHSCRSLHRPHRLRFQSHPCWPERRHPCHRAPALSGGRPRGRGSDTCVGHAGVKRCSTLTTPVEFATGSAKATSATLECQHPARSSH